MIGSRLQAQTLPRTMLIALLVILAYASFGAVHVTAQTTPELQVKVELSRDSIGMDEQVILQVVVIGSIRDVPEPRMPTLPMFEVYSQGRSTNISYSNGVVQASVTNRYMILPKKPGVFPISNISVVLKNKRYVGNSVTLTVLGKSSSVAPQLEDRARDRSGKSKDYFLEASVNNRNPYVNQQVTLTLKFYIAVQNYGSPELIEPTTTGFWTELLGTKGPYQQRLNGRTYRVIERKYALFPTHTGELSIGRATISVTIPTRQRTSRRDPFDIFGMLGGGQQVQVRSSAIKIKARPLPAKGRPADFTGTIGRFSFKATPTKREVEVNQPVSIRFAISGVGNIKSVAEPTIPDMPDFRVYKASSNESISIRDDRIGGTKTFEEVFIPKRPGQLEIPSLSFSFFDPEAERYRIVHTEPITLSVLKTEGYVASPELPYTGPDLKLGSESRDIRFIKSDPGDLQTNGELLLTTPLYLGINAIPVLALFATVLMRVRREKLSGDVGYARSRRAAKEARRRLAKASSLATVASAGEFYAESSQAVLSYIGDKLNISPHGLTNDKISDLLSRGGASPELITDTLNLLDRCAFGRYASSAASQADIEQALKDAEALMVGMEEVKF